jgi:LysR family carnitine catabolism transcriptional activator
MNLTPQQLSAFLHLANTGSFGEAAKLQGVSQPSLSRSIQHIESIVGRRLFDRTTRHVTLTATGTELRPIAERLVGEFTGSFGELARFVAGGRGRIVIAALPSVAAALLPPAIARFRAANPDVDFLIRDGLSESVVEAVLAGYADFGLTIRPSPVKVLVYRQIMTDRFGLVCRADDPLAGETALPWSVLAERPFIAMAPASSVRSMTDAACLKAGLALPPLYECAFLGTTGNLVTAGLGITALPSLTLPLLGAAGLVWRPLAKPVLYRSIGFVTRAGRALSPAAERFMQALTAEGARASRTVIRGASS